MAPTSNVGRLVIALFAVLTLGTTALAHDHKERDRDRDRERDRRERSDFALFDGSNPANQPNSGAVCFARAGVFTYHVAVANFGAPGEVRITYRDGDFVRFPIDANGSFAFSQAAGGRGADKAVRVSNGGSPAQLAGTMSALGDGPLRCISCDADSSGDAGCDRHVPN